MIYGFGGFTAVDAAPLRVFVKRLTPMAHSELGTQFLKEHRIACMHPKPPGYASSVGSVSPVSMCLRLHFWLFFLV